MPIYTIKNKNTGDTFDIFISVSEKESYDEVDECGNKIYRGNKTPEDNNGQFVFTMIGATVTNPNNHYLPKAQRKFGEKFTTPRFNQNKWV